jgi:hypothetical protein
MHDCPMPNHSQGTASIRRAIVWRLDRLNRSFSAPSSTSPIPGAMPQAQACTAPLALKMHVITDHGPLTHLPGPKVAAAGSGETSAAGYLSESGWGAR